MQKTSLILLLGIAFFLVPNLVYAQEKGTRLGVGLSMANEVLSIHEQLYLDMFDYPSFYMPILISQRFKIEPEAGLWRYSYSFEDGGKEKRSISVISLGFGIFPMTNKGKVYIYYGARFRLVRFLESYEQTWNGHTDSDDSKTDIYFGPAIGGEYFFTDHFTLGGEVQLNFTSIGQFDDEKDASESLITSKTLIFVRWYF